MAETGEVTTVTPKEGNIATDEAGSPAEPGQVNGEVEQVQKDAKRDKTPSPSPLDNSSDDSKTAQVQEVQVVQQETNAKKKKKKGRDAEHMSRAIIQALDGLDTPEEKVTALSKKYADVLREHRELQGKLKLQQRQMSQLQKERDHLQSEHGKALLAKSKLESLCRELQRHNKTVKEESLQRAREEEEKRKEVSAKFQQTINEITSQMQENHARNMKLKEENLELATKLKNLVEQYERREEHIDKMLKHKELEAQLFDAKLQQANLTLAEEKEKHIREKAILLNETADVHLKCEALTKQEAQLKSQLGVYTEKFEEFQTTLTKSNEVFQTFKQEMDKMTKKIKKLEKETNMWKVRWEGSNKTLKQMTEERALMIKTVTAQKARIEKLEKLCRALQAERNAMVDQSKLDEDQTPEEMSSVKDELGSEMQDVTTAETQDETTVDTPAETLVEKPLEDNGTPSETAVSSELSSECSQSDDTKPEDTKPEDTKPEDTNPEDTKQEDTKPEDTEPIDTEPVDTKPEGTKSEDTKPC
ncbi:alpha-taxilin-like [Anneissia japonica]|uniref:alpha-taxilin-like n=1 Tax=Anneissia japonica TaxID=1529436 RepID=UPI0014259A10|nr:alpha-taxilin-like [Anneissia japonica]